MRFSRHLIVPIVALVALARPASAATTFHVSTEPQLQAAVASAQDGDQIVVASGVYVLTQTLTVDSNVTIQGDAVGPTTIDGNGSGIFNVNADNVAILNLTLRGGSTAISYGGSGVFSVTGVTVTGNEMGFDAGDSSGVTQFTNSTIAANTGRGFQVACAEVHLANVTVSNNDVGFYFDFPCGETMQIANSLIVNNTTDCDGGGGFTLVGDHAIDKDGTCVTMAAAHGGGGFTTSNPGLGALAANGGPTETESIPSGSSAKNTGDNGACPATDQRGFPRSDGACDVGAFEFGASSGTGNTPPGTNVAVSPAPGVTVTFATVTTAGDTTATQGGPLPPTGFAVDGVEYDISTTAAFTGSITICLPYNPTVDPTPHIFHFDGTAWNDVTTSTDTTAHIVCGSVTSLSPFGVFFQQPNVLSELHQLQVLIDSFNLKKPATRRFTHRLDEARRAFVKSKHDSTKTFCREMSDFIKDVQKAPGRTLTTAEANQLLSIAMSIVAQAGC